MNYSFGPALLAVSAVCLPLTAVYAETQVSDPTRNFRKNVELAKRGDALAQLNVGVAYDTGHGVEKDLEQALSWYRKAAEQGYAKAQYNLGLNYYIGKGVTQN